MQQVIYIELISECFRNAYSGPCLIWICFSQLISLNYAAFQIMQIILHCGDRIIFCLKKKGFVGETIQNTRGRL